MDDLARGEAAVPDGLTVGAVAVSVGVTVRALHYWDTVGLVAMSARTRAGFRLYTAAEIVRIQRVLIYRELGLSLDVVGELLDAPSFDPAEPTRVAEARERWGGTARFTLY